MTVPPLADFLKDAPDTGTSNVPPLSSFLSGDSVPSPGQLGAAAQDAVAGPDLNTAIGRAQREEYDVAAQADVFHQLLQDPNTRPDQRARLQRLLSNMETLRIGPVELSNRTTQSRSGLSNAARGAAHGLINYGYFAALDLGAAIPQFILPKSIEHLVGLPELRESIAESQAALKEMFDPQGAAGFAGTAAGAVLGPTGLARVGQLAGLGEAATALEPFAVLNSAGMRQLAKVSPSAAAIVAKGVKPGATYFQRLSANLVGSGAVDAVQYADIWSRDDLTTEQKIQSLAVTAAVSAGTAGITALRAVKPTPAEVAAAKPAEPTPGAATQPATNRAAEAAKLAQSATANMQQVNARRKTVRAARSAWEAANPEGAWKDLPKEVRDGIVDTFQQIVSRTNLVKPQEPAAATELPEPTNVAPSSLKGIPGEQPVDQVRAIVPGETILRSEGSFNPNDPGSVSNALNIVKSKLADRNTPLKDRANLLADRTALERVQTRPNTSKTPPPSPNPIPTTKGEAHLKITTEQVVPSAEPTLARSTELPPTEREVFVEELLRQNAELINQRNEAQRLAETDELTGLPNQRAWLRAVESANADPAQEIVFFDLKNLKAMNDLVSMEEGNAYIVDAAKAIETAAASTDSPIRVFRAGGDEFAAIVPKGKSAEVIQTASQILGESTVGEGYPTGLRGVSGSTSTEADAGMKAMKAGESAPKYRKLTGAAANKKAKAPVESFYGIPLKKLLTEMNEAELEAVSSKLDAKIEAEQITPEQYRDGLLEIKAADDVRIEREAAAEAVRRQKPTESVPDEASAPVADVPTRSYSEPASGVSKPVEHRQPMEATRFRTLTKAKPKTLSTPDLVAIRDELDFRLKVMDRMTAKESGYLEILAKINEEIVTRASPDGITLNLKPQTVGVVLGLSAGMMDPQNEEQRQLQNAMYVLAVTAIAGPYALRKFQQSKNESLPKYQQDIRSLVQSVEDGALDQRQGIYTRLMHTYESIVRRDLPITNVTKLIGGRDLPAGRNPGKRAEIFGLWRQVSDAWLGVAHGNGVGYWTNDGQFVKLDALTMSEIAQIAEGDLRSVGDLAAAKRELELRQRPMPRTLGLSISTARDMYANASEALHRASTELTKYFRALAQSSVASGLLSKELFDKFQADEFYVAVRRLFHNEPGKQSGTISTRGPGKSSSGPENLFHKITGSRRPFQNPAEAAIDLTGRYHKANELNRLAVEFFDQLSAVEPKVRSGIGRLLTRAETPAIENQAAKIALLKQELGAGLSDDEAIAIASALSDESLNVTSDVVRLYRNGKMEAWQVSDPVARAFRSLQPFELEAVMEGANILTRPTQIARVGITANPIFIGRQAIRDIWQFFINGTYGVDPSSGLLTKVVQAPFGLAESGIGSIRGWLAQMFRTQEYRNFVSAGAGGESVASQGLRIIRGNVRESSAILGKIKEAPASNQFGQIVKELRQLNFREAYASMMEPIANAGRVGAYLRERGRGADVIEAIWRAKKAGANFNNRGSSLTLRALDRMTLFLNPSLQGLDASRYAFMRDPTGYIVRGVAGITIPSMLLWMANKDDDEIDQLRRTEDGKRFWFTRMNGNIVKIAKPIFDGQVFGSTAETWLDKKYKEDPVAVDQLINSMASDVSLNLLPFVGVVPLTMMTGKVVGLGSDLIPPSTEGLDVEYKGRPDNTYMARLISGATAPTLRKFGLASGAVGNAFTPAGIDFMTSQFLGSGGAELSKALSVALEYGKTGELPIKEELPFVRSVLAKYPSTNTAAIQEFYATADKYESAVNTVNFLARTDPARLEMYLEQRQNDIMVGQTIIDARASISDIAKAIQDLRYASTDIVSHEDRRVYERELTALMIDVAKSVNEATREIQKENK